MSIDPRAKVILAYIGALEAPKGYDQVYGGILPEDRPPKPLTTMTIREVLDWQQRIDPKYRSEAAGQYQIIEKTLLDLVRQGYVSEGDLFDAETQDYAGWTLMRRRGYDSFASGLLKPEAFGDRLAREWASLPVLTGPKRGASYYAGDGLNKALTKADTFEAVLKAVAKAF